MSRTRQAVETTMNGDADHIDPAVRRALMTLADHIDDALVTIEKLNKTVMYVGGAIMTSLIAATIGTLLS